MKQNADFTFLISCVFGFMAITAFFFWLKAEQVGWKYRNQSSDVSSALLPHEKKLIREYRKKIVLCIVIGTLLLFILYLLHGTGILLPASKE